jgi:DNA-binding NtrC family response regulator
MHPVAEKAAKILWIDEDARALAGAHRAILAQHPKWQVSWVSSWERGIRIAERNDVDVLLTEASVSGLPALRFLSWFHRHQPEAIALVVTARPDLAQRRFLPANVQRVLLKPTDHEVLIGCIERALRARRVTETSVRRLSPAMDRASHAEPEAERRAASYRSAIAGHAPLSAVARVTRKIR